MAKLTELIKCNIDIITREEFDNSFSKCSDENKIIHELMDDKFGIQESRIDGLHSHLIRLLNQVNRLERLVSNQAGEGSHE